MSEEVFNPMVLASGLKSSSAPLRLGGGANGYRYVNILEDLPLLHKDRVFQDGGNAVDAQHFWFRAILKGSGGFDAL